MTEMNYEKILQSFFKLNLATDQSFFKQTKFLDDKIEAIYKMDKDKRFRKNKFFSDAFFIFCFTAVYFYIIVHDYGALFANLCLTCLALAVFLIALTHIKNDSSFDLSVNHVLVFTLSFFLNSKVVYIACFKNTRFNDNDSEIIRTIVYDFISSNLLTYLTLDNRFSISFILYLLNLSGIIVAQINSNHNYYYHVDSLVSLLMTLFFYRFKKIWEASDRDIFSRKYRFEKFFHYTREYIQGINGYYLNISQDFNIFCDSKMKTLLNDMQIDRNTGLFKHSDKLNESYESFDSNDINYLISDNYNLTPNENYGNLSEKVLSLFTLYDEKDWSHRISDDTQDTLADKLKSLIIEDFATANFVSIGEYKLESLVFTRYFDVHFRKFFIDGNNSVNDIIIYDITELVASKRKIYHDSLAKEKFLAKIVHEFKTPINSIIGVICSIEDLMRSSNIQQNITIKMHLKTIRNLSNYVIFLISDIIHFANIKSFEEIKLKFEEINLREIIHFCFFIMKSLLKCNQLKEESIQPILEYEDEIDNLHMMADEIRLKQIILNLISNAVKFTKSGWIKLKCSILHDQEFVMVSIIDTGIGFKEQEQNKLFKDFYMVNNETINNPMGSGLGLSISKSLATIMNIQISTKSIYGQGTEFSLAIPFLTEQLLKESILYLNTDGIRSEVDEENEIHLQGNNIIQSLQLSCTEISYQTPYIKNEIRVNEYKIKPSEVKNLDSSKTLKLCLNDFILPSINFSSSLKNEVNIPQNNHYSRKESNYSMTVNRKKKDSSLEINDNQKGKILIVDDNYFNCEATKNIIKNVLKEAGSEIEIIVGSDGADIIHYIIHDQSKGNQIKCIITDELMEYLNGSDAIKIIRDLESQNKIKFVAIISVTGNEDGQFSSNILNLGAQLVLSKPLPKKSIAMALKDLNII